MVAWPSLCAKNRRLILAPKNAQLRGVFQGAKERNVRAAMSARDPFRFRFQSRSVRLNIYGKIVM